MSQILSSVYNFSLELPLGLNKTWANLSRYVSWRMWITFFVSLTMIDLGHWVHNYSESQKIFTFLLAFSRWLICQTLMKVWRFQKFKLYVCIHLQLYLCIKQKINVNETFTLPSKSITLILQAGQFPQIIQMPQYSSKKAYFHPYMTIELDYWMQKFGVLWIVMETL